MSLIALSHTSRRNIDHIIIIASSSYKVTTRSSNRLTANSLYTVIANFSNRFNEKSSYENSSYRVNVLSSYKSIHHRSVVWNHRNLLINSVLIYAVLNL